MTPRQFLRHRSRDFKWTADVFRLDVPCSICRGTRMMGREVHYTLGGKGWWSGLCERDFRRVRISMGRRKAAL